MDEDLLRTQRNRQEISSAGLDAVLCQLTPNVVMLTGYAPVVGHSFALVPAQGEATLIVPEGEEPLARSGWCTDVRTYSNGLLDPESHLRDHVGPTLKTVASERGLSTATIGFEGDDGVAPASYSQIGFPSVGIVDTFRRTLPNARFVDVSDVLAVLRSYLTPREARHLASASNASAAGLRAARDQVRVGARESTIASTAEAGAQLAGGAFGANRVLAYAHVMTGARSAQAYLPFATTNNRAIQFGDPVLVQLEVYADGFWTNVSRTFFAGDPGAEGRRIYEACLEAGELARRTIHDGVAASDVDAAGRDYLTGDGFGPCVRHGLGHGVGFEALQFRQPPRLYPGSTDTLRTDMAVALRPGVYVRGWGGVRIGDVVLTRAQGCDLLTNIPRDLTWAMVPQRARF